MLVYGVESYSGFVLAVAGLRRGRRDYRLRDLFVAGTGLTLQL